MILKNLKEKRLKAGLSQAKLSALSKIHQANISSHELGNKHLSETEILIIEKILSHINSGTLEIKSRNVLRPLL